MDYKELLDKILLSDNVVELFYNEYENNSGFKIWLNHLIPEVENCESQEQNNPWHKYNVLGHILHSVEAMNKLSKNKEFSERKMLAYIMFLHDIGKPECHIERIKDGEKIDSFFNHNIASERIARRVLPSLDFNDNEVEIMSKLINKHDIFMFIRLHSTNNPYHRVLNNDLIQEEINDLNSIGNGQHWLSNLVLVGRSDNLAQNEEMTGSALELLNEFDSRLKSMIDRSKQ